MAIDTAIKLLIYRRTKIVATLGPSSKDAGTIERLINAGANVFRLNMSHGTHDDHRETYQSIRAAAKKLEKPIAILADLSGPKIRIGKFPSGHIEIVEGDTVKVTTREVEGGPGLIPSQYKALADDVKIGDRILLDDGNFELSVKSIDGTEIECLVINGGFLKDHKGMNLPGVDVSAPSLTEKDQVDAHFALDLGVDFLALSFVRRASDIVALRTLVSEAGTNAYIIAKIEKPEALDNINEILEASDGIMVARGDLGVELPPQSVPNTQAQLISLTRKARKPVIVATQMLESMMENPRPTRAEVSDVANAVRSGTDAVMLSGETAAGRYPVEAVKMMNDIARQAEAYQWSQGAFSSLTESREAAKPIPIEDAISESTAQLSRDLLVRAIMVISRHGRSLAVMSSSRPAAPIVGVCFDRTSTRIANLLWGVIPVTVDPAETDDPKSLAKGFLHNLGLAGEGSTILVVKGFDSEPDQNMPNVTVITV